MEINEQVCFVIKDSMKKLRQGRSHVLFPANIWDQNNIKDQHFHQLPELMFLLSGNLRLYSSEQYIDISVGDFCLIPAYCPHIGIVTSEKKFTNLVITFHNDTFSFHFANGRLNNNPIPTKKFFFKPENLKDILYYSDQSESYFRKFNDYESDFFIGNLLSFLSLIEQTIANKDSHYSHRERSHKLKICLDLVESNISDSQLSVRSLSNLIGCSPNYLSSIFSKEMGDNLSVYINEKRCNYATRLLTNTSLLIEEIAWKVGYADPAYFCRTFKKYKGISPRNFRKSIDYTQKK